MLINSAELTQAQLDEINEMVKRANGKRRTRIIGQKSINLFINTLREHFDTAKTVRVYSADGFVANSYNYRADITYLQATKTEKGWEIVSSTGDAKRSFGAGARVTIDGRAV